MESEPAALIGWFLAFGFALDRIGLEAGPLSQWLYAAMAEAGLAVELLETQHVRTAFKIMPVKTDRKDARGIAQLMRLGWFRPVHCKSLAAQEVRAVLTARKLLQGKLHDVEMSLRGILRGFGLKVGKTTPKTYEARILELVEGHSTLELIAGSLLKVRQVMQAQFMVLERRVRSLARQDERTRRLMTTSGIGVVVSLTFVAAIDEADRFKSSRMVGAHFGLTPRRYQSGETDYSGRISKVGDVSVRTALFEAAHVILTRPTQGSDLKTWALGIAKRSGMSKAKVALARKLAVVLHSMMRDQTEFVAHKQTRPAVAARCERRPEHPSGGRTPSVPPVAQVPSPGRRTGQIAIGAAATS